MEDWKNGYIELKSTKNGICRRTIQDWRKRNALFLQQYIHIIMLAKTAVLPSNVVVYQNGLLRKAEKK